MSFRNAAKRIGIVLLGIGCAYPALGAQDSLSPALTHFVLKNGLTVILSEDLTLPVVSVVVCYNAGSIHEVPGKTGIAYLLEKLMMSSGSANVSAFEHISDVTRVGGSLNATVFEDRTQFYQTVPSNHLAMALWLESDRMRSLDLTEEKFEKARSDLLKELQDRRMSEPFLNSYLAFDRLVYSDFPFSHSLLGDEDDIRNLSLQDVKSFYDGYYGPQNAVLCITGHFHKLKARELAARYFETLPPSKIPPFTLETPVFAKVPNSRTVDDNLASSPALFLAFRLAPPSSADYPILTLLDFVLMRGRSSRLPRRLLNRNAKIAYQLTGGIDLRGDRPVYKIFITASQPQIPACQNAVFAELDRVKKAFLSDDELAKAKTLYRQSVLNRTATTLDRAFFLIESHRMLRSAGRMLDDLPEVSEKVLNVTATDIVGIVNRYFVAENGVVLQVRMK